MWLRGLALAIAFAAPPAFAQGGAVWSLQTIALRDASAAGDEVARLRALTLPAYATEVRRGGIDLTRVRLGCFTSRAAAERWGGALARIAPDALPVQLPAPPSGVPCARVDVGFRKPTAFTLISQPEAAPLFEVVVAGEVAWIQFAAGRWQLHPERPNDLPAAEAPFRQGVLAGDPFVLDTLGRPLCPGRLLRGAGAHAIVDAGDAVIACAWGAP